MRQISEYCLLSAFDDRDWLEVACFNAQQSLELLLRYFVLSKQDLPIIHDIQEMYGYLKALGFEYSAESELLEIADKVTLWEQYEVEEDTRAVIDMVKEVYNHIDQLKLEYVSYLAKVIFDESSTVKNQQCH